MNEDRDSAQGSRHPRWHGVNLMFDRSTKIRFLFVLLGSVLIAFAEVAGVAAVLPLMELLTGIQAGGLLDLLRGWFGDPPQDRLAIYIAGIVVLAFAIKALLTIVIRWWSSGVMARQQVATSTRIFRYYLRAPYQLHTRRGTSDLIRTMNDAVGQAYAQTVQATISAIADLISIVALLGVLLVASPGPAVVAIVYFAVASILLQIYIRPRAHRAGQQVLESSREVYMAAFHALGGIKEIKIRHSQEWFLARFQRARWNSARAGRLAGFLTELPKHILEVMFVLGIGVMTAAIFAGTPSQQAITTLALFATAGLRILPSISRFMGSLTLIRSGQEAWNLVVTELDAAEQYPTSPDPNATPLAFTDRVRFDDVRFQYDDGTTEVLRGIDLTVPAGHSLAIVGGSGAGKSTLVDILLGLHDPTSGRVLVDGVDIAEDMAGWQRNVAMVPQEVYLFDVSLAENISFDTPREQIDPTRLSEAIRGAQLESFVADQPEGVDTDFGERGSRLSGGQRQRIGIARALYREPKLLVLDEATSALDNETERKVTETVQALSGRITVVVVAHRLSTVRHCDRVAFLKEGRVEAYGTFDEVRQQSPEFNHLVELGRLEGEAPVPASFQKVIDETESDRDMLADPR